MIGGCESFMIMQYIVLKSTHTMTINEFTNQLIFVGKKPIWASHLSFSQDGPSLIRSLYMNIILLILQKRNKDFMRFCKELFQFCISFCFATLQGLVRKKMKIVGENELSSITHNE